ncbi:unnamed protein product [Citrullus colocynthis]|uniref:BHLH domain-containing protein n=1 Tax=Citrullus colocynthis TaxID=252529 RepID=A0ABP0XU08_9ROSI
MEFNSKSPFSFDFGDDLFTLPSLPPSSISPPLETDNVVSQNKRNGRRKKAVPNTENNENGEEMLDERKKRKLIHRDVERQRRQEMSSLYTTLRSLLPFECLKGKRSISDHMQEAVNYIQYMQRKIQQLSDKRDELRKLFDENTASVCITKMLNSSKRDSVVVRSKNELGVQVVLDTAIKHRLLISNILHVLLGEGFEVLSCISNKLNERLIHTIECQPIVNNDGCYPIIDTSELQHKLSNLEYFPLD